MSVPDVHCPALTAAGRSARTFLDVRDVRARLSCCMPGDLLPAAVGLGLVLIFGRHSTVPWVDAVRQALPRTAVTPVAAFAVIAGLLTASAVFLAAAVRAAAALSPTVHSKVVAERAWTYEHAYRVISRIPRLSRSSIDNYARSARGPYGNWYGVLRAGRIPQDLLDEALASADEVGLAAAVTNLTIGIDRLPAAAVAAQLDRFEDVSFDDQLRLAARRRQLARAFADAGAASLAAERLWRDGLGAPGDCVQAALLLS